MTPSLLPVRPSRSFRPLLAVLVTVMAGACDLASEAPEMAPALRVVVYGAGDAGNVPNDFTSDGMVLDLGAFGHSRDYYLLVLNDGDDTVRDIRVNLEADHAGFAISPTHFEEIRPSGAAPATAFVRLAVEHGLSPADASPVPIVPRGRHNLRLTLTAIAGKSGEERTLRTEVTLRLTAQITDVEFFDGNGDVEKDWWDGGVAYWRFEVNGSVPVYRKHGPLWIVNTGDVETDVQFIADPVREYYTIAPSDTVRIMEEYNSGWVRISPVRATLDYSRFPIYPNRFTYLYFSRTD